MKVLIAGLGSIGRRHLRNLVAIGQEDILLYRTHHSTLPDEELAAYPEEGNLEKALGQNPVGVIISNPTALHLDVALPAAKAGCHLLLEKPIADKMGQQVEALNQIIETTGIKTLVGFQFRFHPVLSQVKGLIEAKKIGRPLSFRVHWGEYLPGWHPWEDYRRSYAARKDLGGGVVNTLCHPLDYVRWLFGEVRSLKAVTKKVSSLELDVEDTAEIILEFEDGTLGSIHLDYYQRPPAHWLEINCEMGHIRWENEPGSASIYNAKDEVTQWIEPPRGFERNDLFIAEMRHFLALLSNKESSRCTLKDGIAALKLTEAVHLSSREGKRINL